LPELADLDAETGTADVEVTGLAESDPAIRS
jgi:hypothetical protein